MSKYPYMSADHKRWHLDEEHYRIACGCVIFHDEAGSHHAGFCKFHQAMIDEEVDSDV